MNDSSINRRSFIERSTKTLSIAAVPYITTRNVIGANEKIVMGIIGAGGRGRGVMNDLRRQDAEFNAVCEVYPPKRQQTLDQLGNDAKPYDDYRELLEQKDIDAVLIATPEHQHCVQLIHAVQAGKDAYCEKPMSNSIEEGFKTVQAVRETKQVVQIGMQRRSSEAVRNAKQVIDDGKIGKVYMVKAWWNWTAAHRLNNSPLDAELDWQKFCYPKTNVKFEPMKYRYWRYFWPFSGGNCTDQGTHLMDVVQWFMNSGPPKSADCHGGVYEMFGSETPDVFTSIYDYGDFLASWTLNYNNKYQNGWSIQFQGTTGTMMVDGHGARVYGNEWRPDVEPDMTIGGGIPTSPHTQNFLDCVRSREEPNAPVEVGHSAVCGPHLANVAWHNKNRAFLNSDASRATTS